MSIPHAEKQAIVERIERRIDAKVHEIQQQHMTEYRALAGQVKATLVEQLGLTAVMDELKAIAAKEDELAAREKVLRKEAEKLVGKSFSEYQFDAALLQELQDRAQIPLAIALNQLEWGQRIVKLRAERDNLVDTVLVATTGKELKTLWTQFNALLGVEPTEMETKALAIEPA